MSTADKRWFPLLPYPPPILPYIPWAVAERAYAAYSAKFGTAQSIECLAERGGFAKTEMDMLLPTWRQEVARLLLAEEPAAQEASKPLTEADVDRLVEAVSDALERLVRKAGGAGS